MSSSRGSREHYGRGADGDEERVHHVFRSVRRVRVRLADRCRLQRSRCRPGDDGARVHLGRAHPVRRPVRRGAHARRTRLEVGGFRWHLSVVAPPPGFSLWLVRVVDLHLDIADHASCGRIRRRRPDPTHLRPLGSRSWARHVVGGRGSRVQHAGEPRRARVHQDPHGRGDRRRGHRLGRGCDLAAHVRPPPGARVPVACRTPRPPGRAVLGSARDGDCLLRATSLSDSRAPARSPRRSSAPSGQCRARWSSRSSPS